MELTEKQERYCQLASVGTYADAYRAAYNPSPGYDISSDYKKLNKDPRISRRIWELRTATHKPVEKAREFLLAWWFDRMTYDASEITAHVLGACRHCHGVDGKYQWRLHEFMEELASAETYDKPMPDIAGGFGYNSTRPVNPACEACDGRGKGRIEMGDTGDLSPAARAAFEGVKTTKDGCEIKMADKHKAAEQWGKLCGLDVIQIRSVVEPIPDPEELAALRADPEAAARIYARIISGGDGRAIN